MLPIVFTIVVSLIGFVSLFGGNTTNDVILVDTGYDILSGGVIRIIAYVESSSDQTYEIDIQFGLVQSGEETQTKTLTFIIEGNQEREFTADFTLLNPAIDAETQVQIIAQHKAS